MRVASPAKLVTRAMRHSDLEQVAHNEAVAYPHPWSKRIFVDCLKAGYHCRVVINQQKIVAHGVMSIAVGECHLLTLCVHPQHQRQGIGSRLFKLLLDQACKEDARVCFLDVRQSNTAAIAFYRTLGFVQMGERKNYYPDGEEREHALVMSCKLPLD
ncbi:MAG: ribosomal protein S18-alanine N-acetyltransferase [Pseudohongiellaceae bacterium]